MAGGAKGEPWLLVHRLLACRLAERAESSREP